ncbi:unnamed protein product [Prorocentrum cordatum]|uniref:Uncharacterized protein n=1 Tax=Prorocentrum cordatum TaxID=2364126 RepID=A0ABN9WET9_9DINO|nr:unnamed protein product [Polarella glacialis]
MYQRRPASSARCAASKHFHEGQPSLRALVVDNEECVSHSRHFHGKYLPVDELCIFVVPRRDVSAHSFVDSISERHSAEIMHLFLCSFLTCTGAIPDSQFPSYGARLIRLKVLWILQPPRGWSELVQGCTYDLRDCVVQLVRSAAGTLDDLAIIAQVGLFFCDVEEMLSAVDARRQERTLHLAIPCAYRAAARHWLARQGAGGTQQAGPAKCPSAFLRSGAALVAAAAALGRLAETLLAALGPCVLVGAIFAVTLGVRTRVHVHALPHAVSHIRAVVLLGLGLARPATVPGA